MDSISKPFERIGVRVKFVVGDPDRRRHRADLAHGRPVRIDVGRDRDGEFFDVLARWDVDVRVVDVQPAQRHLLLLAKNPDPTQPPKSKFLFGHDERHWFVAAVPEVQGVRSVLTAMEALKPPEVVSALNRLGVSAKHRNRRRNDVFVRQGEWFFLPRPGLTVDRKRVFADEPIRRGGGKPHWCQWLYRTGGETVYVNAANPSGIDTATYAKLSPAERQGGRGGWFRPMQRDARVFVRSTVRHVDHATLRLNDWHELLMNTENRSAAMRHLAFLD